MITRTPEYFDVLRRNITDALHRLRDARVKGDRLDVDAAERLLNSLVERFGREHSS